ncbi:eukaryotic translation initiation factor 2-alpha kinase, partial [Tieghemiomyces parasiticus]
ERDLAVLIDSTLTTSLGSEMVFELANAVQEYITTHHAALPDPNKPAAAASSYQAMVQRTEQELQAEQVQAEAERYRQRQAAAEAQLLASRDLERRINEELDHKRSIMWQERQRQRQYAANSGPGMIEGDMSAVGRTTKGSADDPDAVAQLLASAHLPLNWRPLVVLPEPALLVPEDPRGGVYRHLACAPPRPFAGIGTLCSATALPMSGGAHTGHPTLAFGSTPGRPRHGGGAPSSLLGQAEPPSASQLPVTLHQLAFRHPYYRTTVGAKRLTKLVKEIERLKLLHHEAVVATLDCQIIQRTDTTALNLQAAPPPETPARGMARARTTPAVNHQHDSTGRSPPPAEPYPSICVLSESSDDGFTLAHALRTCGPLSWVQAKHYLKQLLYGLVYLHASGFVHRALSCQTILLTTDERHTRVAKLMFIGYLFTLSTMNRQFPFDGHEASDSPSGSAEPAVQPGKKCDLYDLGVAALHMLLGSDAVIRLGSPEACLRTLPGQVPEPMVAALDRALARDPRQRPTALELLADPFFRETGEEGEGGERIPALYLLGGPTRSSSPLAGHDADRDFPRHAAARHPTTTTSTGAPPPSVAAKTSLARLTAAGLAYQPPVPLHRRTSTSSRPRSPLSRYRADFEEIEFLGKGGFGEVVKARNRLDDRYYAIKKIRLDPRDVETNRKILREVTTLSRLHHEYVVRYYTTWFEDGDGGGRSGPGSDSEFSSSEYTSDETEEEASHGEDGIPNTSFHNDLLFVDESRSRSRGGIHFGRIGGEYTKSTLPSSCSDSDTDADRSRRPVRSRTTVPSRPSFSALRVTVSSPSASDTSSDSADHAAGQPTCSTSKFFAVSPGSPAPGRDLISSLSASTSHTSLPGGAGPLSSSSSQSSAVVGRPSPPASPVSSLGVDFGHSVSPRRRPRRRPPSSTRSSASAGGASSSAPRRGRRAYRTLYIQMEYCEKSTMRDAMNHGLGLDEAWRLFRQILEGLVYIHAQGMIHRDLKPSNLFLDANGDVKIGDFGLATSNLAHADPVSRARPHHLDHRGLDDSLTADVGTALYVAPEVAAAARGETGTAGTRYNQKVDMYSLGIIFFEMIYPLRTGMERAKVLNDLRRPEVAFPREFPDGPLANQRRVITWLLHHEPRRRPTSLELYQSELLPPRMEDDYIQECVRTIANPSTPYYNRLMSALFDQYPDRPKDFTYDFNSDVAHLEHTNSVYYDRVHDYLTRVFRRHGAVEVCTPHLMPKLDVFDQFQRPVCVMDSTGTLVQLPYDLTLPFARYVARTKLSELKRFSFDKIYKANPVGGQPRQMYEVDFDSVWSHPSNPVGGAEVVQVVDEVFADLPMYRTKSLVFLVSHSGLLEAVLDHIGVPEEHRRTACSFLRQLGVSQSLAQVRQNLMTQLNLPRSALDVLERLDVRGDLATIRDLVAGTLIDPRQRATAFEGLDDLARLEATLRLFRLRHRLVYAPLLVNNYHYYRGHFFFQLVSDGKKREVLATGGRYDRLVQSFMGPTTSNAGRPGAVVAAAGVNIAVQKLILEVADYQSNILRSLSRRQESVPPSFGLWSRKRCDVAIASFGRALLAERIAVAQELWLHNIRTDFLYDDNDATTAEMVARICINQGINWIVNLKLKTAPDHAEWPVGSGRRVRKPHSTSGTAAGGGTRYVHGTGGGSSDSGGTGIASIGYGAGRQVLLPDVRRSRSLEGSPDTPADLVIKVRNLIRRTEEEVTRADLPQYLASEIHEQQRFDLQLHEVKPRRGALHTGPGPAEFSDLAVTPRYESAHTAAAGPMVSDHGHPQSASAASSSVTAVSFDVDVIPGTGRSRMKERQRQIIADRALQRVREATAPSPSGTNSGGGGSGGSGGHHHHPGGHGSSGRKGSGVGGAGSTAGVPVLAVDLGVAVLRRLVWCNLLTEDGLKRGLDLCSAHQRDYLRQLVEAIAQQRATYPQCPFVWLYSYRDDYTAVFPLTD